ncbi:MAG: MFS transporter [Chloroflexi bacterium]|nr:MFS transporter [Chloroflexota bacterium]MYD49804.1 MFS transporter [Chloroflexota bacterium]
MNIDVSDRMNYLREQYHYAWLVVGMGTMLRVTANFVSQAFAVILVVLQTDFAWGVTAIVLAQVFRSLASALLSPVSGWVGDRYGARRSLFVAAALYVAGMLLLSTVSQLWQLYIYYSILLGLAQALFTVNIPTTVAAWFKRKLGIAVGIQQSFGGMGASVTAPALALLVALTGWQVGFWIIAAVGGTILFSLLLFFHSEPADRGMKPLGATDDDPAPVPANSEIARLRSKVFLRHARRTRAFWNLPLIHFLGCVGHAIVIWHVVFFATEQGLTLPEAAWIVTIYTMASVSSRLFIPILADRWGAKMTMILPYALQGITVAMLFWAQSAWEFYLFAVLFGIGFGGEMSAFLIANRQYYGMGPVRSIFGFQHLGSGFGMAVGGLIGGVIYDFRNAEVPTRWLGFIDIGGGSYDLAWVISIVASLAGVGFILLLESSSRVLIPDWEESLSKEGQASPAA